jgi:hypothetical protein
VNSAFWPIIDNFERTLKSTRDETINAKLDKLEALIVTPYGRPLADVRFVAPILSIPYEERYGALPMTPQKHKDETLRTLVDIVEAAARRQSSMMLFEDAQWAGSAHPPAGFSVAMVRARTCRRAEPVQAHADAECCDGLHARRRQGTTRGAARANPEQILTRTGGVPLFVEELTKTILESGELKDAGDHYECLRITSEPLAVTLSSRSVPTAARLASPK